SEYSFTGGCRVYRRPSLFVLRRTDRLHQGFLLVAPGIRTGCRQARSSHDWTQPWRLERQASVRREGFHPDHRGDPEKDLRLLKLAVMMNSLPAHYYDKYFFTEEMLAELAAKGTPRAEDIINDTPMYWQHYEEQAKTSAKSQLDRSRSRGGITEFELAIDAIDRVFNDRNVVIPVNMMNKGHLPDFPDDLVVEIPALVNKEGFTPWPLPLEQRRMPRQTLGLVKELGEYQYLAAKAAWKGDRLAGIQALCSNPLVRTLEKAEKMYDEMAHDHRKHLPRRLRK